MADPYSAVYNPDVLSCLANLSSDEVFTPPEVANQVLDMLPPEIWSDRDLKILDPCSKSGVFLREAAKRLIKGQLPEHDRMIRLINEKKRSEEELSADDEAYLTKLQGVLDHIYHEQLFGIAITELTALMSRRSLYCSKWANGPYSVSHFDDMDGNLRFKRIQHKWSGKAGKERCVYCGASRTEIEENRTSDETHAYELIHVGEPKGIFNMKFDVIIGNPPYQLSDGGNQSSAMPIYQKFVEQAKKLNPRYLAMIIPARWYVGGRGLDAFRSEMLNDDRIRELHDFVDASECFPGVEIKGGVCYFLWERGSHGECDIYSHKQGQVSHSRRPLLEEGMETFLRTPEQISILEKVRSTNPEYVSDKINAGRYFGFHTRVTWDDDVKGRLQTADGQSSFPIRKKMMGKFDVKVYIAHGEAWIERENVVRHNDAIDKAKVLIPRSGNPYGSIIGKPKYCESGACSSNTYNVVVFGEDRDEAENFISYLKTRFVRFLIATRTSTQDTAPKSFEFVPVQDWSRKWSDDDLYEMYHLSPDEIQAIESNITEME